jgi:putative membrane protein (TIGR04086 family)
LKNAVALLKCLVVAYIISAILLLIIAFLLYKADISEGFVTVCIILIYCVSSLFAGFMFAKRAICRRFVWGLMAGAAYFMVICVVSAFLEPEFSMLSISCITTLFICTGSGMVGGMVSQ